MSDEKLFPEGYIVVKLDRHESRKTSASTSWKLPKGSKLIYTTINMNKTHWFEYWVTKPNSFLLRIRITNRGNWDIKQYISDTLKISDEELNNLLLLLEYD